MRETILIAALSLALAGCDQAQPSATQQHDEPDDKAVAASAQQVNEMMAATRQEALEARVATLENQMDTLKAEADTRADLRSALATPAPPPAPPPVAPRLPYEPPAER